VDDGEALRKRLDLEEEVLVAEERDCILGAHYVEADAPLCEVGVLLFCRSAEMSGRSFMIVSPKRKMRL